MTNERQRHANKTRLDSTTSFLTAAVIIYASGAGITAAAGTRLALHLILEELFKLNSWTITNLKSQLIVKTSYYLTDVVDKLRACCLPWM